MEVIASFQIDHLNLKPGIYVSRQDGAGDAVFTTYDIRMTAPNQEPAIQVAAMHTIEHLAATYLRNHADYKEHVVYWGPMGCMTGSYLIMRGAYDVQEIRQLMMATMDFIIGFNGEVPGTTPAECGNYLLHDLPMAQWEARRYKQRLEQDFHCEYTPLQRADVAGMAFHDA